MKTTMRGKWLLISCLIALPCWYLLNNVFSRELLELFHTDKTTTQRSGDQYLLAGDYWKGISLEMDYFLFRQLPVKGMVAGEGGFFFTREELEQAQGGAFFAGVDTIRNRIDRIARIQQLLDSFDMPLLVIAGASRPFIYKAYVPRQWLKRSWPTNLDQYAEEAKAGRFSNFLDFNAWASAIADTSRYPLLNPMGPDWSAYGRQLWADTLLKWIDHHFEVDVPEIYQGALTINPYPATDETAYWKSCGLLYYPRGNGLLFAAPAADILKKDKWIPRILAISRDHFNSVQWLCSRLEGSTWDRMAATSLQEQLEQLALADMVILMEGENGIHYMGRGWSELLAKAPRAELLHYLRAGKLLREIRVDAVRMKEITYQAWKESVPVDQVLLREALLLTK